VAFQPSMYIILLLAHNNFQVWSAT
jgi:hypothetical protein